MEPLEVRFAEILDSEIGEPVPLVSEKTLKKYHAYLKKELSFPFRAEFPDPVSEEEDRPVEIEVTGLLSLEEHPDLSPYLGLLCRGRESEDQEDQTVIPLAKVDVKGEEDENFHRVEEYKTWYWECRR